MKKIILRNNIAVIDGDTHISRWVMQSGRLDHDQSMLSLLKPYIKKGDTVVDIGAFIGDHTIYYANAVGSTGSVVAFEPNQISFDCLVHNMSRYNWVKCMALGVSDSSHNIEILIDKNVGASHAVNGGNIPCIALDSLNLEACNFMKIDCEGMEIEVLEGGRKTIEKYKPYMLIEVNRHTLHRKEKTAEQLFEAISGLGYSYRNIYPSNGLSGIQFDVICTPI